MSKRTDKYRRRTHDKRRKHGGTRKRRTQTYKRRTEPMMERILKDKIYDDVTSKRRDKLPPEQLFVYEKRR